ncbi:MAG: hypothetical protein Q8O01_03060, partial [Candidatus Omnitrophota bacterium]|nr:hypothetical protein [Candidatus Omnitrophota bacterium]
METLFLLIFWVISVLGIGYSILKILFRKGWSLVFGEVLALSYGIGIAAVSIQMAIISLFGMKFSVPSIVIWWVPLILWAFLRL